jgi:predicted MFS family arabinose efflux permease
MSDITASVRPARAWLSRTALLLVLSALVLSLSTGIRQSSGLFLSPMAEIGISTSAFSFAIALQSIIWGASQPFIGMLADRYGTGIVVIGSALIYAAGLMVTAQAGSALGLDIGAGVLAGIGVAGTGLGVMMGIVSRAVAPEKRSQAVGTVAAAGSLATMAIAPFGQWLIDAHGWRTAWMVFAVMAASMAVLALGFGRGRDAIAASAAAPRPEDDLTLGQILRLAATHPGYIAMTIAFFACGFQLMFITVHLPSYLVICGLPATLGATAIGVIGLCNTVGTYLVGLLGARYSQRRLLALVYLIRTVFIVAFLALPVSAGSTMVFAAAMGFLWLSVAPLVSGLVGRMFGLKHFGALYGFVFLSHQVGSFCGVLLGGIAFDATGSYTTAWLGLIAIGALAFALQWPMDDRSPSERAALRAQAAG